jgi:hypothetical protein
LLLFFFPPSGEKRTIVFVEVTSTKKRIRQLFINL